MSTTATLNAGQMITTAYRRIGNLTPPWTPTDDQTNQGITALNLLLKGWESDGINLHRQTQYQINVAALQGLVGNPASFPVLITGLEECRLQIQPSPNLYERPLGMFTYVQYMQLPNKQAQSTTGPSCYMWDKQVGASNLYLWPLATNGCIINATAARPVNDVLLATDPIDAPIEWNEGIMYNLADRLMDDTGVAASDQVTAQRISLHAAAFYQKLLDYDRPTSVFVKPWGSRGSGKFWR